MKDLYRRSNFPTVIDIYGDENYIKERYYDERFDIEILFGRPVDRTMGASRCIFTSALKEIILKTQNIPIKDFDGPLSCHIVKTFRRLLKENPFKTYRQWVESNDPKKPKEITFPNASTQPEYIIDYLGRKHIILSATLTDEGLTFPMGVPVDIYKMNPKKTKAFILTETLVQLIKEYRFYPHKGLHRFPFGELTFVKLKKEIGYTETSLEGVNRWFAAHLEELVDMTSQNFTKTYASGVHISQVSVATLKTSLRHLETMKKTPEGKNILKMFKKYYKYKDSEIKKILIDRMGRTRFICDFRAYSIIKIARKLGNPIPKFLQSIS